MTQISEPSFRTAGATAHIRHYDLNAVFAALALLLGLGVGIWLKRWPLVLALVPVGLAVSLVGGRS